MDAVGELAAQVAETCWWGGVTYEMCCGSGALGVGNPDCWTDGLTYDYCCTTRSIQREHQWLAPLTFASTPLALGQQPASASAVPLLPAERRWATAHKVDDYVLERARVAQDGALRATFRSREAAGHEPMGQAFNAMGTFSSARDWEVRNVVDAVRYHRLGRALLTRLPQLATVFDGFGSPQLASMFAGTQGEQHETSYEFAKTLLWVCVVLDVVGHAGHVEGQAMDGTVNGLPTPEQLAHHGVPFPLPWDVVEIGAGWGWMALLWQLVFRVRSYSVVDLPAAQLAQAFILSRVRNTTAFPTTRLISSEVLPRYDLFISFNAFSELDPAVREHYLHKLIVRSRRGIILDNSHALYRDKARVRAKGPEWFRDTTGLDLVRRLRQIGFTVRVTSLGEALRMPLPEPVGVGLVISWVNTTEPYPGQFSHLEYVFDWKVQERLANYALPP
eukprot:TRINITY_DN64746_c0_g1_i1.p1 TRINITY_DN64746_c0_g1~~TRINITY_DN64746_c0_g1_i1.p1  ORF type:complete len:446 (-),score=59.69 TRINITY_DN64746_c0_g1_i1:157-1494(-)